MKRAGQRIQRRHTSEAGILSTFYALNSIFQCWNDLGEKTIQDAFFKAGYVVSMAKNGAHIIQSKNLDETVESHTKTTIHTADKSEEELTL